MIISLVFAVLLAIVFWNTYFLNSLPSFLTRSIILFASSSSSSSLLLLLQYSFFSFFSHLLISCHLYHCSSVFCSLYQSVFLLSIFFVTDAFDNLVFQVAYQFHLNASGTGGPVVGLSLFDIRRPAPSRPSVTSIFCPPHTRLCLHNCDMWQFFLNKFMGEDAETRSMSWTHMDKNKIRPTKFSVDTQCEISSISKQNRMPTFRYHRKYLRARTHWTPGTSCTQSIQSWRSIAYCSLNGLGTWRCTK
jgi:hypothetical protein